MTLRKLLFWIHLGAGSLAGLIILLMCITGVLLTYERQLTAWADQRGPVDLIPGAGRVPVERALAQLREQRGKLPATLAVRADAAAPLEVSYGRDDVLFLHPNTGEVVGQGSKGARQFFQLLINWHRWLGERTPARRAVTGAANLMFLFLVMSGIVLWWPRKWTPQHLRPITLFRGGLSGRARDFNWHNVIGFWCAVPLFFIVISGAVMSYGWANQLVYQLTGTEPPAPAKAPPAAREPGPVSLAGLDRLLRTAETQLPDWQTIVLRVPSSSSAPVTFSLEQAERGRPDLRSQLTLDRSTGEVIGWETFSGYNRGRQVRSWLRWIHTGEAGGVAGQTLAGIASLGGAFLVWTGIALALRRFASWRSRKEAREVVFAGER